MDLLQATPPFCWWLSSQISLFIVSILNISHCHHIPITLPSCSQANIFPTCIPYHIPRRSMYGIFTYIWTFGVNVDEYCGYGYSIIHQHLPQMDIISINSIWYSQISSIIFPCGNSPPPLEAVKDTSFAAVKEHLLQGRPFVVTDGARGLPMAAARWSGMSGMGELLSKVRIAMVKVVI